jgi:hypothetical protein
MAETLIIVSLAIALSRAAKGGLISEGLRARHTEGATVELVRELAIEMARRDRQRADGLSMMALELEAIGGWQLALERAPNHARETWESTVEVLRS